MAAARRDGRRLATAWVTAWKVRRAAREHRTSALAAESAFFAALAVFPMLLTVVAVLRATGGLLGMGADHAAAAGMTRLLRVVLSTRGTAAADAAAQLLTTSTGSVLTVGSVAATVLMARALRSVLHGLGVIAGRPRRTALPAVLLALVMVVGGAVVVAVAVQDPLRVLAVPVVWRVLRWPALAVALWGWAVLVLRVGLDTRGDVPRGSVRRPVALGAVVATAGWFAASALLPLYVTLATRFTSSLGALGGGLILLVWLYLLMLSLHLGAELAQARREAAGDLDAPAEALGTLPS